MPDAQNLRLLSQQARAASPRKAFGYGEAQVRCTWASPYPKAGEYHRSEPALVIAIDQTLKGLSRLLSITWDTNLFLCRVNPWTSLAQVRL